MPIVSFLLARYRMEAVIIYAFCCQMKALMIKCYNYKEHHHPGNVVPTYLC